MSDEALQSRLAAERLRADIISGDLRPGLQLKMRELLPRYNIGASPMREALARLAAEGFLEQRAQRGVRVPEMSLDELEDLSRTREIVESQAIGLAAVHGDSAWEDGVVAAFHLYERALLASRLKAADWVATEPRHHSFHRAVVAGCPFPTLRSMCDLVHQRLTRYRFQLNAYRFAPKDVVAEHRLLMEAVLSRSPERAVSAASAHFGLTATVLKGQIAEGKSSVSVAGHTGAAQTVLKRSRGKLK